jgi:hypothetical protein
MLRLTQVEEIEQLLLQLPRIVELQEQQPVSFVARATIWMDLLEQSLAAAHADQAGRIASLHSALVFARHTVARDAADPRGQPTRARRLALEAAAALNEAADLAAALLDEERRRFAEANRQLRELLAQAPSLDLELTDGPPKARLAIASHPELERDYAAVESLVGADDALALLGRALSAGRGPPGESPR